MNAPQAGRMPWTDAAAGPLAGATCLWQDLDGVHVETAPAAPPPTSVLWAWRDDDYLIRARLDDGYAFVAVHRAGGDAVRLLGWEPDDHRVDARRGHGPGAEDGGLGAGYEQIVVDGTGDAVGPVTFLRPVRGGA